MTACVIQMGPGLGVRGGVSAVENLIVKELDGAIHIRHIPTMEEGSALHKLGVFLQSIRRLSQALRTRDPVIVHIHFASRASTWRKVFLARMALRATRPLILHAHGGAFTEFYGGLPAFARRLLRNTFRRADRLVVLSDRWRSFYTSEFGLDASKVMVLHNPVRLPAQLPDRRGREVVQLLYLGRITRSKGAFDLLRAFAELPEPVRLRARLVLAGDGEFAELRQAAAPLGDAVTVFDWVDASKRDELLLASDVFVLPSYIEGLPMALLEAMAYGIAPVVSAVGGIPDVIVHGRNGLLIAPGDIPQLSSVLRRLIEDEGYRLELGRQAREQAAQFDVVRYADDLLNLYRSLLKVC